MTKKVSAQLQAKLRKAREKFAKAEPAQSNSVANRKVPDGTYTAKLVGCEFDEFGKHPILRFTYEVTDADKKSHESAIGELVETRFNIDTDEGPSFIKRDFSKFGYDEVDDLLDDVDAANQLFSELLKLNPVCKVAVAMDDTDQWQNVFLNDVLEMDEEAEEEEPKPKKKETKKGGNKKAKKEEVEPEEDDDDATEEDADEGTEEADDEGTEADDEDVAELEVGDLVEVEYKGTECVATVLSINEEEETVKVQLQKQKKRVVVPAEKVFLLEG